MARDGRGELIMGGGAEWRRLFTGGASGGGLLAEAVSCVHMYRMSRCLEQMSLGRCA